MNSEAHRGFPGKFESINLSRDNLSREVGRNWGFLTVGLMTRHSSNKFKKQFAEFLFLARLPVWGVEHKYCLLMSNPCCSVET